MSEYQYIVKRKKGESEPSREVQFSSADFARAREQFHQFRKRDFYGFREETEDSAFVPHSTWRCERTDEEGKVEEVTTLGSTLFQQVAFPPEDPVIREFYEQHIEGMRWFLENEAGEREFFTSEGEALHKRPELKGGNWQLYNLDRFLDDCEERALRFFLKRRPAISTNGLEIQCKLGRGTISKIKLGHRKLNRKQYARILPVLVDYGYVPHLDLRMLEAVEPELVFEGEVEDFSEGLVDGDKKFEE